MSIEDFNIANVKKVPLAEWEERTGVRITRNCSGKMEGLWAINTSMKVNPLCQVLARHEDYICSKCYASQYLGFRKSAAKRFEENFKLLTAEIFDIVPDLDEAMKDLPKRICRDEMYGDLYNQNQAANYMLIAIFNPTVSFGQWTKHVPIIENMMKKLGLEKPDNLSLVASSIKMNQPEEKFEDNPLVDHVFTVYTGKFATETNTETNCAAMSCYNCERCYHRGGDYYINEMLKSDHRKKLNKK